MKKSLRLIAFALVLVLMSTSLCGCQALDTLRSNHAVYTDENTIEWNGEPYKMLPESYALCPKNDYSETVFVTDSDVPTLLSVFFGDQAYVCNDGRLLECENMSAVDYMSSEDYFAESSTVYYCQAAIYDAIVANIEKAHAGTLAYDTYSYSFSEYDETTEWYEQRTRIVTAQQAAAFKTALETAQIADGAYDWQMEYITDVEMSTEDLLFYAENYYMVYRFTVSTTGTSYIVWDALTDQYLAVDASYNTLFEETFAPAIEAMESEMLEDEDYDIIF